MASSTNHWGSPSASWWNRVCHRLWQGLSFLYGTFLIGLLINLISNALSFQQYVRLDETAWVAYWNLLGVVCWSDNTSFDRPSKASSLMYTHGPTSSDKYDRTGILASLRKAYTDELTVSLHGVTRITLGLHERFDLTYPTPPSCWAS